MHIVKPFAGRPNIRGCAATAAVRCRTTDVATIDVVARLPDRTATASSIEADRMTATQQDSFRCQRVLSVAGLGYAIVSLPDAVHNGLADVSRLPVSLKVLLENLIRHEDGRSVTRADIEGLADWPSDRGKANREIAFRPARVLMQDFTGVPALVDLAAMREAMVALGGNPSKINPLVPVDLVCDHSLVVDNFGTANALN